MSVSKRFIHLKKIQNYFRNKVKVAITDSWYKIFIRCTFNYCL